MTTASSLLPRSKGRLGYWLLALVAVAVLAGAVYLFVGTLVTGLFLYYAVRPANRRIRGVLGNDGIAAIATLVLVVLPLLTLVGYVLFLGVQNVDQFLDQSIRSLVAPYVDVGEIRSLSEIASDPREILDRLRQSGLPGVVDWVLGAVGLLANAVVHVFLMTAVVFYLLRDDRRLAGWYRSAVGDGSPAHVLARHVDRDISGVYFSNVLFMSSIGVLSAVGYTVYNLLAPSAVQIPLPIVLGVLTGVASIVPLVVGKLVYAPISVYLFGAALQSPGDLLVYPVVFTVFAFLFLDFIPLTFLLPVMAGRTLHSGLMIFAYVGGTLVFGWYGLFLGPLVLVLTLRVMQDLLPDLLSGTPIVLDADEDATSGDADPATPEDPAEDGRPTTTPGEETSDAD
jgi:predicted PurR-regulated permease PerM